MSSRKSVTWALTVVLILVFSSLTAGMASAIVGEAPRVLNLGKMYYQTVVEAVEEAEDGDVILVGPGVYDEPLLINKQLTIIGDGPATEFSATTFVTSSQTFDGDSWIDILNTVDWNAAAGVTTMWADYTTSTGTPISGVTIQNCAFTNTQHGVYFFGAKDCVVQNSTFTDCYRGVSIQNHMKGTSYFRVSSGNIVQDCTFTNMKSLNNGEGEAVAIHDTDNNIVRNNTVDGCEWGVMIYGGDNNIVKDNEIVDATYDALTFEAISSRVTVENNIIRNNGGSVHFNDCDNFLFTDNTIENSNSPIRIEHSSGFTFSGNTINGSAVILDQSTDSTFANNNFTISDNSTFVFNSTDKSHYDHNITTDNVVGGNPIHYYYDQADASVTDVTASSITFAYCENPTVTSCNVVDGDGIRLISSPYSNITADVTNCKYGIDLTDSGNGSIDGCVVNTSDRGVYGIRMNGSVGQNTSNTHIEVQPGTTAWKVQGGDTYYCYNTTFRHTAVNAKENRGGELWVYSTLGVRVLENDTMSPLEGVDVELSEDSNPFYSTSHFGGTDNQTDAIGEVGPFLLLDRIYKNHHLPIEQSHDLDLWIGVDAIWSKAIHNINMSNDLNLVLETTDVWKPAMPGSFTVTDIPAEDALEATWDLNTDDTVAYDLWSNITGTWALLMTLTAAEDTHRIDEGLVHGEDYYFWVSARDEVPLESDRTESLMVNHVDGLPPAMITGFEAPEPQVNGTDLSLVWNTSLDSDVEGYRVYINETGGNYNGPWVLLTPMAGITATTYWVKGLASETTYHFVVTAIDERPNESPLSQFVTVTTDDITPPDPPVLGDLPEFTNEVEKAISGTAEPGSTVTLLLNNEIVDVIDADDNGRFSATVTLNKGINVFTAVATDPSGNVGATSAEVRTFLDLDAPEAPVLTMLPTLTNVADHTASGTAESLSKVTILLNGEVMGMVDADVAGSFELPLTLVEGENTLTAFATDFALNDGPQATIQKVVLDTIAPEVPSVDELPDYTNVDTHSVTGTAEPGTLVEILAGPDVIGSLAAEEDGSFSYAIKLRGRETVLTVRATDDAGNVGGKTSAHSIILDQEAPEAVAGEDKEVVEKTEVLLDGDESTDNEGIDTHIWTFQLGGEPITLEGTSVSYTFPEPVTITVNLKVTDRAGNSAEDTVELTIISSNLPPILRRDGMTPSKGSTDTKFEFSVEFKDTEGDNGEVWIVIDGESILMIPDPDDTDTTDGQRFAYESKLTKGDHTYYFRGKDTFGNDAGGPSAGEENTKTSPDIEDKKVSDTPGPGAMLVALAMLTLMALHHLRRTTRKKR